MTKLKYTNTQYYPLPDLPNYDPTPADGVHVGESPVPGLTLLRILRGHRKTINRIVWSPDGRFLASSSKDKTVRIWNVARGECTTTLTGHKSEVLSVAWSPDGKKIVAASWNTICIWDTQNWKTIKVLSGYKYHILSVAWSPTENVLAFAMSNYTIQLIDTTTWKPLQTFERHEKDAPDMTVSLAWSPDGKRLLSAGTNSTVGTHVWDIEIGKVIFKLRTNDYDNDVVWFPTGKKIALASTDNSINIFNTDNWDLQHTLEGHTDRIRGLSISVDGHLLASRSLDGNIMIWLGDMWKPIIKFNVSSNSWYGNLSFDPFLSTLAVTGDKDSAILIFGLNLNNLTNDGLVTKFINYTTAKIVLVGDSGVGKTGLGWRLSHGEFKEHSSTHGQQFWVIDELGKTRDDGTKCEAVLWDLAGQPDYRLVHSLFLDDVDTALVLFDPTNRQEPLSGVDFWLNQLKSKEQELCNSILVGARVDRGTSTLTDEELRAYCERNGICGGYISTSAQSGYGLPELLECLKTNIPWDEMPSTVTTQTFKCIKEYVLKLKEQTEHYNVLVQPAELGAQLKATNHELEFSDAEMMTSVGHLAKHGYVTVLRGSQGVQYILLAPDLLANLASSIVLEARRNPRGLGVLEESRLLAGQYAFLELHALDEDERELLLDAAAVLFLEHNLCFRETFNEQTFLVFPSLINEKRPKDENITPLEGASYRVKGAVENVYASLVVLLGYTNTFMRTLQWQNQAQYEMGEGEICGFQQTSYGNGEIELVLYYDKQTPEPVRLTFRGLFERFLSRHELEISRYQPVLCPKCKSQLARNVVMSQLAKHKDFSFCNECGEKLSLPNPEPLTRLSRREELILDVQQTFAQHRTAFEVALVRVKALLRDRGEVEKPTCFISYAWGVPEHERWILQLAKDLRNASIEVLLDRWHSPPGSDLGRYIDQIEASRFVIVVGTPELKLKYDSIMDDRVVAAELELINLRARQPQNFGRTTLPLLLAGDPQKSFPPQLQRLVSIDFRSNEYYFRQLFDTIWRIHDLPFDNLLLEEIQASLSPRDV